MLSHSVPRTTTAILITALWPGGGHALIRRWWDVASWTLLMASVLFFGWLTLDVASFGDLLNPVTLRRLVFVNALLAVVRLAALIDVVVSTDAHSTWTGTIAGLVVMALLLTPHAIVHRMTADSIAVLETVFVESEEPQIAVLSSVTEAPGALPPAVMASPEADAIAQALAAASTVRFENERNGLGLGVDERFTVLLLGTDAGYGREGERSDSIMVVSIDPRTMQTAMFGIPRNWGGIPIPEPWPGPDVHPDMANTIYQYGHTHADFFAGIEDPGAAAAKVVFGDLLGIEIDHYVKVNMEGFVAVIDAMGGLEVNVTFEVDNEFSLPTEAGYVEVDLNEGVQTLSGLEAMGYARSRKTSNDYHRMGRQRCMVIAIAEQLSPADVLLRFRDLARAIGDHVTTDIPLADVPALINLASLVDTQSIETVTFVPPLFVDGGDGFGHKKPHIERVRAAVSDALSAEITGADGVSDGATACEI